MNPNDLKNLPPPPQGQTGISLDQFQHLPPPPAGQQGLTLDQVKSNAPIPFTPSGILGATFKNMNPIAAGAVKGAFGLVKDVGAIGTKVLDQTSGRITNAIQGKGFTPTDTKNIYTQPSPVLDYKNLTESIAGNLTSLGAQLVVAPEIAVDKLGMTGLTWLAEHGKLSEEALAKAGQFIASKWGTRAVQVLNDFVVGAGVKTASNIAEGKSGGILASGAETAAGGQILRGVLGAGSSVLEKTFPSIEQKTAKLQESAIQDATPHFSPKLISQPSIKSANGEIVPRVQEGGGIIKQRSVTPTSLEKDAGIALSKVPEYPTNGTALQKYNAVQPEIAKQGQTLANDLANENILRPPREIINVVKNAIRNTSEESLLLSKSDPTIKQYMRVLDNAISQNDGTLAGELKIRQTMDSAYKNARGKMAFGDSKISSLDEIHSAARDALNQDIIDKAQNTDVKAALKAQWDLYRGSNVLLKKAEAEAGSKIEQIIQKNPITSKIIKAGLKTAGLGAGLHVIP